MSKIRCLTEDAYLKFIKTIGPKEDNILDGLIGEAEQKGSSEMHKGLMRRPFRTDGTLEQTEENEEMEHIKWARQIRTARLARKNANV